MAGRLPILSSLLLAAAPVMGAGDKFLIQFEMHPYVEVLNYHLDRIGNNEVSGAGIMHNIIYSRYVHGRLIEEHLQQAVGHIQVNRDSYAPFFELPIDIIIPSEDVNENDYIRRPKQSLQQHDDAAPEDNEQYEHRSRYERDLKIRKVILSSDISIATTTIPYARSLSSLKTNWQDGSRALPVSRERQLKCTKLDDVCTSFSSCLKGDEVDTAQLIEACKAHLVFMKSGGNSLRLVAKDLESNLQKAEKPFKKSPEQGRTLSSLLQSEREAGIHKGSILKVLKIKSAEAR